MTAKEKAKELVDKMYLIDDPKGNYLMSFNAAKQCALLAVDEILNHHYQQDGLYRIDRYYWQEVKKEIENR
jgi:hypothetical protein